MITGDQISTEVKFQEISSMWGCTFSKTGSGVEVSWDVIHNLKATSLKLKTQGLFLREYLENKINRSF